MKRPFKKGDFVFVRPHADHVYAGHVGFFDSVDPDDKKQAYVKMREGRSKCIGMALILISDLSHVITT